MNSLWMECKRKKRNRKNKNMNIVHNFSLSHSYSLSFFPTLLLAFSLSLWEVINHSSFTCINSVIFLHMCGNAYKQGKKSTEKNSFFFLMHTHSQTHTCIDWDLVRIWIVVAIVSKVIFVVANLNCLHSHSFDCRNRCVVHQ